MPPRVADICDYRISRQIKAQGQLSGRENEIAECEAQNAATSGLIAMTVLLRGAIKQINRLFARRSLCFRERPG